MVSIGIQLYPASNDFHPVVSWYPTSIFSKWMIHRLQKLAISICHGSAKLVDPTAAQNGNLGFMRVIRILRYTWHTLELKWMFYPLVMTNIAMGNGPFIDGLPIENGDFPWLC